MKKNLKIKMNKIVFICSTLKKVIVTAITIMLAMLPVIFLTISYLKNCQQSLSSDIKGTIVLAELAVMPVIVIIMIVCAFFIYINKKYEIRKDKIIAKVGVISKAVMYIDTKNIVTVCYNQTLLEALTGCASILINTNATQNDYIVLKSINNYKRVFEIINKLKNK